jgi:pimeloyl-ACP methyl ester carboxylesterase
MNIATMPKIAVSDAGPAPRMSATAFGGCFGWMHVGHSGLGADTAVLLCSGLDTDALTGHQPFRLLADELAEAGYPTLRFDYPGTGDSCDLHDAEYWSAWLESINIAADWLRDQTGATRIVLCGLRFGAMLAAVAAERRNDVAGLILFAPVVRGNSYVRQLFVQARLLNVEKSADGSLELRALRLSARTIGLISQTDLRKLALSDKCKVAVFSEEPSSALSECMSTWRDRGVSVSSDSFDKLQPLLRSCTWIHERPADYSDVLVWLRTSIPVTVGRQQDRAPDFGLVMLRPSGCTEIPLRFGLRDHLFGLLCRPAGQSETELAVVIVNAGGVPRYGVGRQATDFARRLAAHGISSLRMDFAGLGDSVSPAGHGEGATHIFETDRVSDISAAIDALEELGFRRFVVHGLCSGAYHAFQAALVDWRVHGLLLVNLPLFSWHAGDTLERAAPKSARDLLFYINKLKKEETWRLLLRGQLNPRRVIAFQYARIVDRLRTARLLLVRSLGLVEGPTAAQTGMQALAARQVKTLFLFSPWDGGVETMKREFGSVNCDTANTKVRIIPGMDHDLNGAPMRRLVGDQMIEFLAEASLQKAAGQSGATSCLTA